MKSTIVQDNSWHTGTGIEWTGKKSHWPEVGDSGAKGSSATGDGGQAVISLTLDADGVHIRIF